MRKRNHIIPLHLNKKELAHLETQVKEEKEQNGLLGIIAEKVSEEGCTEQCESCQKYCPVSEECMATDENVRCTKCEYLCEACGICELKK